MRVYAVDIYASSVAEEKGEFDDWKGVKSNYPPLSLGTVIFEIETFLHYKNCAF